VISATGGAWRTWRGGQIDAFLRPDVNVYHGFSGGALVNAEGRFIGVNTTGLTRGAPATIPAATVSRVVEELLSRGHVRREALMIISLEPEGPAAKSGVFLGDVLLKLEGQAIADTDDVQAHLGGDRVGRQIEAEILRGGSAMTIKIMPGERPAGGR
jgi:S1-C subfamily serine protease